MVSMSTIANQWLVHQCHCQDRKECQITSLNLAVFTLRRYMLVLGKIIEAFYGMGLNNKVFFGKLSTNMSSRRAGHLNLATFCPMCKLNLSFSTERHIAKRDLMLLASVHYTLLKKNIPIRLITSTVIIILLQPLFHDKKFLCVNLRLMSLKYNGEIILDLT